MDAEYNDNGITGDLDDLQNIGSWTATGETCLDIDGIDLGDDDDGIDLGIGVNSNYLSGYIHSTRTKATT